jgi:hypothetical protein
MIDSTALRAKREINSNGWEDRRPHSSTIETHGNKNSHPPFRESRHSIRIPSWSSTSKPFGVTYYKHQSYIMVKSVVKVNLRRDR